MVHGNLNFLKKKYKNLQGKTALELSKYQLTSLDPTIFHDLSSLTSLSLNYNELTTLDASIFNGLRNLTELSLSNNQLTSLEWTIFNDLHNLTELWLNRNKLTTLGGKIFSTLGNLTQLWLSDNQLTSLDSDIFKHLHKLNELWISKNRLTSLDATIFNSLHNLNELWLNNNRLTSLDPTIFNGLANLSELSLSNNQLTSLDSTIFNGLCKLKVLLLHENKLISLNSGTFAGLTDIKLISLYKNVNYFSSFCGDVNLRDNGYFDKTQLFINDFSQFLNKLTDNSHVDDSVSQGTKAQPVNLLNNYAGKTINNYKLLELVDSTPCSITFSSIYLKDNTKKSIKIVSGVDGPYVDNIQLLNTINSPFIVSYYEHFDHDYLYFTVFEHSENGDLSQLIERHQKCGHEINASRIFYWTIQAVQGLQALHAHQIIHRDIRPANMFLSGQYTIIKLGSLGMNKSIPDIKDTSPYLSPELAKGECYSYNTDIWSLGCVLYELQYLKPASNVETILQFEDSLLSGLTKKMLKVDSTKRPTSDQLYQHMMKLKRIFEDEEY